MRTVDGVCNEEIVEGVDDESDVNPFSETSRSHAIRDSFGRDLFVDSSKHEDDIIISVV